MSLAFISSKKNPTRGCLKGCKPTFVNCYVHGIFRINIILKNDIKIAACENNNNKKMRSIYSHMKNNLTVC